MTIMLKVQNADFLKKLGVEPALITGLESAKVKVLLAWTDIHFTTDDDKPLISVKLSKTTNDVMKGTVPPTIMEGMKSQVSEAIKVVLGKVIAGEMLATPTTSPQQFTTKFPEGKHTVKIIPDTGADGQIQWTQKPTPAPSLGKILKDKLAKDALAAPVGEPEKVMKSAKIHLKDAERLYQPVFGTSPEARYFVIGIAGSNVKLAAKIEGNSVSVRAEGFLPAPAQQALSTVGLGGLKQGKHGYYMSGHFDCAQSTPERLIGAILAGSGLDFETPMPSVARIRKFVETS